jgi:hypothetical protein
VPNDRSRPLQDSVGQTSAQRGRRLTSIRPSVGLTWLRPLTLVQAIDDMDGLREEAQEVFSLDGATQVRSLTVAMSSTYHVFYTPWVREPLAWDRTEANVGQMSGLAPATGLVGCTIRKAIPLKDKLRANSLGSMTFKSASNAHGLSRTTQMEQIWRVVLPNRPHCSAASTA